MKKLKRLLSALLALCLILGMVPAAVFAAETDAEETVTVPEEQTAVVDATEAIETVEETEAPEAAEETIPVVIEASDAAETLAADDEVMAAADEDPELYVADYATFLKELKILEQYAASYYATDPSMDTGTLVLNFIRCGVEKYVVGLWPTLAGQENTAFTAYVQAQDAANGTTVMALRNLERFEIPNGQRCEFAHMFGAMNIAYITASDYTADLGSWAGDITDLIGFCKESGITGTDVEAMADQIREGYLGVDMDDISGFGNEDIWADLDAYYLIQQMRSGVLLSTAMEGWFTADQTDNERAAFFLNNRFTGVLTQEDARTNIYDTYASNKGISVLEADYGISRKDDATLIAACCYAVADYFYGLADGMLTGGNGGEDGGDEGGDEGGSGDATDPDGNPYYDLISSTTTSLAPGVTQTINYAYTADEKQIVFYIATVDVARDDLTVCANYKDNDPSTGWGMSRVTDQMAAAEANHADVENYSTIVGVNADFYNMSNGRPSGALVMEGVVYNGVGSENFFAILDDGSAVIGTPSQWSDYADRVVEAVGGSILLVKDGKSCVTTSASYYNSRASRTCIGITADGKVVLMVLDGRQEPFSAGGSAEEIAQIMLDAGCVIAMNLDGGGSTTFAAKPEGSDTVAVVNKPSDGYARSVSSSLMVVSTAKVSNEFDHALISSEYDYLTVGTELALEAVGVSASGNAADIPEGAQWKVSDAAVGSVKDGVFTGLATGYTEVQLVVGEEVVGSKELYVVTPDTLYYTAAKVNMIYGVTGELPLAASYKNKPVAINPGDVKVDADKTTAVTFDGFNVTGVESSGYRVVYVTASLLADPNQTCSVQLTFYKADEAMFDFDTATGGDRQLAWNRVVSNSTTTDNILYQVVEPAEDMEVSYTFALDMEAIDIPDKLADLTYMLPGADDPNASAWSFLLQLAERVSVLTEVKVVAQFDQNMDVDVSNLKVSNEYFYMQSSTFDETTNTLTIICKWIDQEAAIDASTANPMCILSGIKMVPKDNAAWDSYDQINVVNKFDVSYDIYLRANALYSFALDEANQENFNLYPFDNPDVIIGGTSEKGAHFADTYASVQDTFTLDSTNRQGWYTYENFAYYFVDNVAVTGLQRVPGYDDPQTIYFYRFNEDGTSEGPVTGLVEYDGGLYFSVAGIAKTGWQTMVSADGSVQYYYFDPATGKAVDGKQTIGGYNYEFEDCILVKGQLVTDGNGTRYMWAGTFATQTWLNIDGKIAYAEWSTYFATGLMKKPSPEGDIMCYAFGDDGFLMSDYYGIYQYKGGDYLVDHGYYIEYPGLFKIGDYYYYINSQNTMMKSCTYWLSKTNGLLPVGSYTFDAEGRIDFTVTDPVYTITWKNADGTILETDKDMDYGKTPTYDGATPTMAPDAQYTYKFSGWTPSISSVMRDTTYTATYETTLNTYTVTWKNADGTVLETDKDVPYGTVPTYDGAAPTKAADARYTYTFKGWDKTVSAVSGNVTYTAEYSTTNNNYTVTWKNADGTTLATDSVAYGTTPKYSGATPTMEATAQYAYTFKGWDKTLAPVTGDVTFTATYITAVKKYTVTWKNEDGTVLETDKNVKYGETPKFDGETPTKASTAEYKYVFLGWDPIVSGITGNTVLTAVFTQYGINEEAAPAKNGIVSENGGLYYYVNNELYGAGLINYDGAYYYVQEDGELAANGSFNVTNTNDLMAAGKYNFDADGKMDLKIEGAIETRFKNGIYSENGGLYFYMMGKRVYAGLIKLNGSYYYVRTSGEVVTDQLYWVTKTNGLMPSGMYQFDENGCLVPNVASAVANRVQSSAKNGIVSEKGSLYYYAHGKLNYAGLIEIDGSYYYVRTCGEVVNGRTYWITKTNGLLPEGSYTFGEDGKLVLPEAKDGFVAENGGIYYYVDGALSRGGLIEVDGAYYYVRTTTGEVVTGRSYWITRTNGLMDQGMYSFDETGKIVF